MVDLLVLLGSVWNILHIAKVVLGGFFECMGLQVLSMSANAYKIAVVGHATSFEAATDLGKEVLRKLKKLREKLEQWRENPIVNFALERMHLVAVRTDQVPVVLLRGERRRELGLVEHLDLRAEVPGAFRQFLIYIM